jgi:tRNA threonylcarbamoyladenosine dehydratase
MTTDISWLSRTQLLIGEEALRRLTQKHVFIVGLGGVGSFAAEFVARSGVGKMTIVDGDVVDPSNRNRQLPALATNHGVSKAAIMAERLQAINPELELTVISEFIRPENVHPLLSAGSRPDYLIDAIDSITPKITFLKAAYEEKIAVVSSMGAGAKLDPTRLQVVDISKTYNCIRTGIKAVFSPERPVKESLMLTDGKNYKKSAYGTISYLPAVFGAVAASVVIRDLMAKPS